VTKRYCSRRFDAGLNIGYKNFGIGFGISYCNEDYCNGAKMTSSFGHVVTGVALLISVVIGYLL